MYGSLLGCRYATVTGNSNLKARDMPEAIVLWYICIGRRNIHHSSRFDEAVCTMAVQRSTRHVLSRFTAMFILQMHVAANLNDAGSRHHKHKLAARSTG